jgi:hypothetical protein
MIYLIPVVGPLIGFLFMFFLAIPLYWLWNALAPTYFYWLPQVYQQIPFWDCVWLLMLVGMLKLVLLPRFGTEVKVDKK